MDKTLPAVGIDVSKLSLDVRVDAQERPRRSPGHLANSGEGFLQLQGWFQEHGMPRVHACLEATGTYSDAIARFLFEQGHQVSVVNPARVAVKASAPKRIVRMRWCWLASVRRNARRSGVRRRPRCSSCKCCWGATRKCR